MVAGSLQSPGPWDPMARTRTQTRVPDGNGPMLELDLVTAAWGAHVAAFGSLPMASALWTS